MKIHKDSHFKKKIIQRDGLMCKKCGDKDIEKLTVDHIIPISMGGSIKLKNLQFLCITCHQEKDKHVGQTGHRGRKRFREKMNKLLKR